MPFDMASHEVWLHPYSNGYFAFFKIRAARSTALANVVGRSFPAFLTSGFSSRLLSEVVNLLTEMAQPFRAESMIRPS